jgi:hypothetical protein
MASLKTPWSFTMTIPVPSIFQRIQFSILGPSTSTSGIISSMTLSNPAKSLLCLFPQKINWLISSPNLLMESDLSLLEKLLVFVTYARQVFDSCSDKTLLFLLVSSVGCMIFFIRKKIYIWGNLVQGFCYNIFQLSHVYSSVLTVHCALIKYTFIWLNF